MQRKPARKSRLSVSGSAPKSAPGTIHEHPALALSLALNELNTVGFNAGLFRDLAERRARAWMVKENLLNAGMQIACDRANELARAGAPLEQQLAALTEGTDRMNDPPPSNEPPEYISVLRDILDSGRRVCERARAALRAGGAKGLDAATQPNAAGQPRSVELHTKLREAERVFSNLSVGVGDPRFVIDEDAARMADLGKWFARTRDELGAVLETRGLDAPAPTPTVSVSPDLLDRLQRAAAAVDPGAIDRAAERAAVKAVEAMETRDDTGIGGTDTDWKDVQGRLFAKRDRGEPYTSLRKLSDELNCSDATIRKAIDDSETLQGWRARSTGPRAAPRATDLGAVVRGNARQATEPAPDDVLPDDDVDATMARLIDQAKPAERAKLNALDDAGRRALVATCQSQNLDDEPSPLEPDKPGVRPRKVKQHKRA